MKNNNGDYEIRAFNSHEEELENRQVRKQNKRELKMKRK